MKTATVKGKKKPASRVAGIDQETIDRLVDIFKSLADPKRLQIVMLLAREGSMNVTRICEALGGDAQGASQPAVSHHLKQLSHSRLVKHEREGKFNNYALDAELLNQMILSFYPNARSAQQKLTFGDLDLLFKTK